MDLSGVDVDFLTEDEILNIYNDVLDGNVNLLADEYCQCLGYLYATCIYMDFVTSYSYSRIITDYSCK